jgi:hypothetical protein
MSVTNAGLVVWEETVQVYEEVDSADEAFDQVLREMEG